MIFHPTAIAGAWIVEPERREDPRGFFARTWCRREFREHGLETDLEQCNTSWNEARGTLRGLHFQASPHDEAKLVRCTRGSLIDVALDLRPQSATYLTHTSVTLSWENRLALYIPKGCAHGFQALEDGTEVYYQMSDAYSESASRGVRWDDPAFGIAWPIMPPILSPRDAAWSDFKGASP
jgi:dTDP-4-dehydrorhamnose 3,5-epimerase